MAPLKPDISYHIFNHANGFENVFCEDENYRYFLEKYDWYIKPIAETYAYCLMPNHFHLVIRTRKREVIEQFIRNRSGNFSTTNFSKVLNFGKVERDEEERVDKTEKEELIANEAIEKFLSKQFANLFSSYTQSFNKMYHRMGSLFIKNFKRQIISDKEHFLNSIAYIHRNPVHHGFCAAYTDWSYSSYCEITEQKSTVVEVDKLIKTFGGLSQFKEFHQNYLIKLNSTSEMDELTG